MASRIREYENEQTLKPNNLGTNAVADAAQAAATSGYRIGQMLKQTGNELEGAIGAAGRAAGEFYDRNYVQPEISKGATVGAGLQLDLTTQWNDLAAGASPNDSDVGKRFTEAVLNPAIEKFKEGFQTREGQKWANDYASRLTLHMGNKIIADSSMRAGLAVKQNMEVTENKLSATVMRDPSSFDFAIEQATASVRDIVKNTPGLTGATAVKAETELLQAMHKKIAQAAIAGMARTNPDEAEKIVLSGKFSKYLDGVEELKYLKQMQGFKKAEERAAREDARNKTQDAAFEAINAQTIKAVQPDGTIQITPEYFTTLRDKFGPLSHAQPSLLREALTFGQRMQERGRSADDVTDPTTYKQLSAGLAEGTTTLEKLLKAKNAQKLSDRDFGELYNNIERVRKEPFEDKGFQATLKAAERMISVVPIPGLNGMDTVGAQKHAGFINSFLPKYLDLRRQGKLPDNALDLQDENSLIRKEMAPFMRSRAQMLQDYVGGFDKFQEATGVRPTGGSGVEQSQTAVPIPESLRNNPNLAYSPGKGVFVDTKTGKQYDKDGKAK